MTTEQANYAKPLPIMEGLNGEFFEWCNKGELRFQRCTNCGKWRHIPWPMCANCNSFDWEWARSSGRGKVYTWNIIYQAFNPAFAGDTPYAAAIIELEEGIRMVSSISGIDPTEIKMEMPVEVWFDRVTPEVTLPRFRPV